MNEKVGSGVRRLVGSGGLIPLALALAAVDAEEELEGDPPEAIIARLSEDPWVVMRAVVRATKESIRRRLEALPREVERAVEAERLRGCLEDLALIARLDECDPQCCQHESYGPASEHSDFCPVYQADYIKRVLAGCPCRRQRGSS